MTDQPTATVMAPDGAARIFAGRPSDPVTVQVVEHGDPDGVVEVAWRQTRGHRTVYVCDLCGRFYRPNGCRHLRAAIAAYNQHQAWLRSGDTPDLHAVNDEGEPS